MKRFKDILCVVELSEDSVPALVRAVALAENNQAKLTVVAVAPAVNAGIGMPEGGPISGELQTATIQHYQQGLDALVEPYRHRVNMTTEVLVGTPFLEVIRAVLRQSHDMVIKCPESLDWLDRLFSSNDKHLLRKCPCPVWMVRPQSGESFDRILAAVDVGDSYLQDELSARGVLNQTVFELASSLAVSEFADMHVVHAWEAMGESAMRHGAFMHRPEQEVDDYVEEARQHNARLLDTFIKEASAKLGPEVTEYLKPQLHMPKGAARKVIPQLAKSLDVNCVVMGTVARTGIPGFFMGNTAETILDQLDCSVLAIKPPGFVTPVSLEQ